MKNTNDLLIVEVASSALSSVVNEEKAYILEGVFGQIDQKNKNNRIYTESEYVPQIEALQAKILASKLLGELDHPTSFDTSLKNVSHIIEELTYDKDSKEVRGKIRLLDTDAGRQAKALVDAGIPLQISSRAAGAVESNGKVKIKQLFTYDLVADPGFENAELKRVNESYGFDNDSGLWIYEMNSESKITKELENNTTQIKENKNMAEFVKADDFNKYSEYLANEIKSIKEGINAKEETSSEDTTVENLTSHNDHIVESVNKLSEYVGYLAEKLDESIQYSEHVAEKTDQSISYTEEVAGKVDKGIQYSEHLAEAVTKVKDFSNYLAESYNEGATTHESLVSYVEYLKENLQSVSEYAEYIAESINETVVTEEDNAENPGIEEEDVESAEEIADNDEEGDVKGEEVAKEGDEDADDAEDVTEVGPEGETEEATAGEGEEEAEGEEGAHDPLESYKNEISSKLDALVENAQIKENENPSFFKVVSSTTRDAYIQLNEDAKSKVRHAISKRGFMTEKEILSKINESQLIVESANAQPTFISLMPTEYTEAWANLSEAKKNQITAQSKYKTLNTEYQVTNFWQTRDLREAPVRMEKVEMVKESKVVDAKPTLGYDVSGMADAFKKRFNK